MRRQRGRRSPARRRGGPAALALEGLSRQRRPLLGGIAIQTVVLVALDAFGVRERRPLTYQAASLTLVIEGAVVLAVLVVVMGTQLPRSLIHFRLTPDVVLITLIWVAGLVLTQRAGRSLPWSNRGEAPDSQPQPRGIHRPRAPKTPHGEASTLARRRWSSGSRRSPP